MAASTASADPAKVRRQNIDDPPWRLLRLLQCAYHFPAADIRRSLPAAAVHDRSAKLEMRVLDRFGTASGDRRQRCRVKVGPRPLADPVERIEQADMRRNERWCADDVAQPPAEIAQCRRVLDLDENGAE